MLWQLGRAEEARRVFGEIETRFPGDVEQSLRTPIGMWLSKR